MIYPIAIDRLSVTDCSHFREHHGQIALSGARVKFRHLWHGLLTINQVPIELSLFHCPTLITAKFGNIVEFN